MRLKAEQEIFYPYAGGGRREPVRGIRDWCCLSFLIEIHLSKGENPSETFCTASSFASTLLPVLLKLKAIFKLKQYHTRMILAVSA